MTNSHNMKDHASFIKKIISCRYWVLKAFCRSYYGHTHFSIYITVPSMWEMIEEHKNWFIKIGDCLIQEVSVYLNND